MRKLDTLLKEHERRDLRLRKLARAAMHSQTEKAHKAYVEFKTNCNIWASENLDWQEFQPVITPRFLVKLIRRVQEEKK